MNSLEFDLIRDLKRQSIFYFLKSMISTQLRSKSEKRLMFVILNTSSTSELELSIF